VKLRLIAAAVALVCAVVGVVLIEHSHDLDRRTSSDLLAAQKLQAAEASAARRLQAATRLELPLRRRVQRATARGNDLANQRQRAWESGWRAAFAPARSAAYPAAYRDAFPVALGATEWYVVHVTTTESYDTESWQARNGHEFVVSNGSVASYAPGSAPSPYEDPGTGGYPGPGDVPGYINSDGVWVPSPSDSPNLSPAGPTAICADGTYSYSQHASGTCSHHGGVASWNP
jgi:Protein of unknown function (DUF3761)